MTMNRSAGSEHEHLNRGEIEAFFLHTEQPEDRRPFYHLLTQCDTCREVAHPIGALYEADLIDGASSWMEIEMAISEWEAPALWDALQADFPEDTDSAVDIALLRGDDRWPTWGLCVWLARRSLAMGPDDPQGALRLSRIAALGAVELPPSPDLPPPWVEELRAFTQAATGDAMRRTGNEVGAEGAFRKARGHLETYGDDGDFLPFRPVIFDREAALRGDQGRWEDALSCLDEALEAWECVYRNRETDRARLLRHKARVLRELRQLEEALDLHERATALVEAVA